MSEADWQTALPCELRALARRWWAERRWWSTRFARIGTFLAVKKNQQPVRMRDVFPELKEE